MVEISAVEAPRGFPQLLFASLALFCESLRRSFLIIAIMAYTNYTNCSQSASQPVNQPGQQSECNFVDHDTVCTSCNWSFFFLIHGWWLLGILLLLLRSTDHHTRKGGWKSQWRQNSLISSCPSSNRRLACPRCFWYAGRKTGKFFWFLSSIDPPRVVIIIGVLGSLFARFVALLQLNPGSDLSMG